MKTIVATAAVLAVMVLSSAANAANGSPLCVGRDACTTNNTNTTNNTTNNQGGNASVKSKNVNLNLNKNTATAKSNAASRSNASANSKSDSKSKASADSKISIGGDTFKAAASSAIAPSINPTATCQVPVSLGGMALVGGGSIGTTYTNEPCVKREDTRLYCELALRGAGNPATCLALANDLPTVKALKARQVAAKAAGVTVAAYDKKVVEAEVEADEEQSSD